MLLLHFKGGEGMSSEQNNAQLERLRSAIADAYSACNEKSATIPSVENIANLANCIRSIQGDIPDGFIKPTGNLTDALISRSSYLTDSGSGQHVATIPAGYYANSAFTIKEWATGIISGGGSSGGTYFVDRSLFGFTPMYAMLIALGISNDNAANTVIAAYGNNASAYSAAYLYAGAKASLSKTFPLTSTYNTIKIDSSGITFVGLSGVKYGAFNYRWFALR